jgi:hypothetical protein
MSPCAQSSSTWVTESVTVIAMWFPPQTPGAIGDGIDGVPQALVVTTAQIANDPTRQRIHHPRRA